jgi:histidine triad (HIT) family protein
MACIFCQVAEGTIPSKVAFKDDEFVAFHDIHPQAPTHVLIIPKRHIETVNHLQEQDGAMVGRMVLRAQALAKQLGISEKGYRLVFNCNREAGQSVFHLHLHLLGGRPMHWPPG